MHRSSSENFHEQETEPLLIPSSRRSSTSSRVWSQSPYIGGQLETLERPSSSFSHRGDAHHAWLGENSFSNDLLSGEIDGSNASPRVGRSRRESTHTHNSIHNIPAVLQSHDGAYLRNRYAPQREKSSTRVLSDRFESLDYDPCENSLFLKKESKQTFAQVNRTQTEKWIVMFLIGAIVGLIANGVVISVDKISEWKYGYLRDVFDKCSTSAKDCLVMPLGMWVLGNMVPVLIGSILVVYFAPAAGGSGMAQVKCFLNGVKIPEFVRFKIGRAHV